MELRGQDSNNLSENHYSWKQCSWLFYFASKFLWFLSRADTKDQMCWSGVRTQRVFRRNVLFSSLEN